MDYPIRYSIFSTHVGLRPDGVHIRDNEVNNFFKWSLLENCQLILHDEVVDLSKCDNLRMSSPVYYWLEFIPFRFEDKIFTIHFPKGKEDRDRFVGLFVYFLLQSKNLLENCSENPEVYNFLIKIFNKEKEKEKREEDVNE